jgi:hypothetical protein
MFIKYNPNPFGNVIGDCTVRALCAATGFTWTEAFIKLCLQSICMGDMPSSNRVWGTYLEENGYKYNTCPFCYTINEFCKDHPTGTYILGTGTHVVCVKDGNYYDTWDSGEKTPIYFFTKEDV